MNDVDPYADWPPAKRDNGQNWSQAKLTILHLLWLGQWVEGADIFKAVQQTYYDRRVRELRESGWNIETRGTKYRLLSHVKALGTERVYPSEQQKHIVFQRDKGQCQICGASDDNIQYDHKVPLIRNGETEIDNLQLLCRACNVEKRGACKNCSIPSCTGCPYAFPDTHRARIVLMLNEEVASNLRSIARARGLPLNQLIEELISSELYGPNDISD